MANNLDDITAIRAHFLEACPIDPVIFDNEEWIEAPTGVHARLSVNPGASRRASIARRTYEQLGRVYLQVMIPDGQRDGAGWEHANRFVEEFRDLSLDNYRIRFDTPEYRTSDAEDDWYVITVSVPYTAQH